MKIRTELLQKMVTKIISGAGNNKMIPITSLIGIEVTKDIDEPNKSILTLITTDGSNQLRINETINEEIEEFYTIVNADIFAKLICKTTKEYIGLENKENYLEVIGNGTYKLEIAINEDNEMVKFPDIKDIRGEELTINLNLLQDAIKVAKASVAKTMEVPCLTGYYIGADIVTTNRQLACKLEDCGIKYADPILISSEMAELLLLIEGDEVLDLVRSNNDLIFYNANYTIAGKELEGKELYPIQPITNLTKQEYKNLIQINKQDLLNVLDRMSLFVTDYDKGGVYLTIDANGLAIQSQKSNATEYIDLGKTEDRATFNCLIDIEMLKSQVETISTDLVTIQYGQEKSIKIADGKCTHIISLL